MAAYSLSWHDSLKKILPEKTNLQMEHLIKILNYFLLFFSFPPSLSLCFCVSPTTSSPSPLTSTASPHPTSLPLHNHLFSSSLPILHSLSDPAADRNYKTVSRISPSQWTVGANTLAERLLHDHLSNLTFISSLQLSFMFYHPFVSCHRTF